MVLTYHEIAEILDTKYICAKTIGFTLLTVICQNGDPNLMVKSLHLDDLKINIPVDNNRL